MVKYEGMGSFLLLGHQIALAEDAHQAAIFIHHRGPVYGVFQKQSGRLVYLHVRIQGYGIMGHDVLGCKHVSLLGSAAGAKQSGRPFFKRMGQWPKRPIFGL